MLGCFTTSIVGGYPSTGFAVRCCSLCFLVLVVWWPSSLTRVSTADCVDRVVRRGSGRDVIADAVGGPSLACATGRVADFIPVLVVMAPRKVTDDVGRSDDPRRGCRTDMDLGRGMAGDVALAT